MPARQPKQTAKKAAKGRATSRKPKDATAAKGLKVGTAAASQRRGGIRRRTPKARASWKPASQITKNYVLHTFDSGMKLLMHKVSGRMCTEVYDALISARNQVAVSLETLQVPSSKLDYKHLSTTLLNLKDLKQQLEQRHTSLTSSLDNLEKELQTLQEERDYLQGFRKASGKHHPLLLEPMEKELHLNFDTVK